MRLIAAALVALLVISGCAGVAWLWLQRPQPLIGYYNVTSSDGKAEVQYKLGNPRDVEGPAETSGDYKGSRPVYRVDADPDKNKNAVPKGQDFRSFDAWDFENPNDKDGYIVVEFTKAGRVYGVGCYSLNQASNACNPVLGIHIGDTEDSIIARLGKADAETRRAV